MVNSGSKAYFTNVDGGGTFYCQFNPKELKLDDTASWKPSDEQGQSKPLLTYEKGQPAVLSMDLVFDTTDTGGSVRGRVEAMRAFLAATVTESDAGGGQSQRPPHVNFHWKDFEFKGVVEKISASMLMFKADGTPLRAKISVTLKERSETARGGTGSGNSITLSSAGTLIINAGSAAKTITSKPNQTLSQAAAANQTDFRTMAKANPQVTDPMNVEPGKDLVVPNSDDFASVMGDKIRARAPVNIGPELNEDVFATDLQDVGGAVGNIAPGEHPELSADFTSSGMGAKVDQAAQVAHDTTDRVFDKADPVAQQVGLGDEATEARGEVHEAINDAQEQAHDVLGSPAFDDLF